MREQVEAIDLRKRNRKKERKSQQLKIPVPKIVFSGYHHARSLVHYRVRLHIYILCMRVAIGKHCEITMLYSCGTYRHASLQVSSYSSSPAIMLHSGHVKLQRIRIVVVPSRRTSAARVRHAGV